MDEPTLEDWMDRHHVEIVRTHATNLEGLAVGKYINRPKFLRSLPDGHSISDMALAMDITGTPHFTFWHEFRHGDFGDILLRPDINTIVSDGTDADLGHCICDFVDTHGNEISLCPRTLLRRISEDIDNMGYSVKAAFELEFFIYHDSFDEAARLGYQNLDIVTGSHNPNIYLIRNAYRAKPFMDQVIKRLNWQGFAWESWSDEGGIGQVEINFPPTDPVTAADTIVRVKQIVHEVAVDSDMSVTFMASLGRGYGNGLHVHHSLQDKDGNSAFVKDGDRTPLLNHWIAGITRTMRAATSLLCPTYNAYRRLRDFTSPPVTATWGEENKTAGLRLVSRNEKVARIEHRLPSGDANPYLVLATILAGGVAGLRNKLAAPPELDIIGWGLPADAGVERLPTTLMQAVTALEKDEYLHQVLGDDVIEYWLNTRRLEWQSFHDECGDTNARAPTDWEFKRYFCLS